MIGESDLCFMLMRYDYGRHIMPVGARQKIGETPTMTMQKLKKDGGGDLYVLCYYWHSFIDLVMR